METMIDIDGSFGEGGGQILRTSLALSIVTGQAFRIGNIRAARRKPGLRRQHLAAVNAAAEIAQSKVEGASLGSRELMFRAGSAAGGEYQFSVGTSGSATLVLQTILPALIVAGKSSTLILEGGTHNPHAPPFDFLQNTFLPIVNRMGPTITVTLERRGFYPAGGGRFTVLIKPASRLSPIQLLERGKIQRCRATAIVAGLPEHIAQRELNVVRERLGWADEALRLKALPDGPGNVLMLELQCERITETFTGFGERGVPAERVAEQAVTAAKTYLDANVPVGKLLADQLILPFAIAASRPAREDFRSSTRERSPQDESVRSATGRIRPTDELADFRSSFKTLPLSSHASTNIEVVKKFLDVDIRVKPESDRVCIVEIIKAR